MSPVLAHTLAQWRLDPTVALGLLLLCGLAWYWRASLTQRNRLALTAVVVLVILALESPIDYVADRDFFSVHMLQHLILLLGVAPALVLSAPPRLAGLLRRAHSKRLLRAATHPGAVLLLFSVDVWIWHLPALYNAALYSEVIHTLEHLSFVAVGLPFWWIVLDAGGDSSLSPLFRALYLFLSGVPNVLLGIILAFSSSAFYAYARAAAFPGYDRALVAQIGLSPLDDQHLGGLLMWVGGSFFYLAILVGIIAQWLLRLEAAEESLANRRASL